MKRARERRQACAVLLAMLCLLSAGCKRTDVQALLREAAAMAGKEGKFHVAVEMTEECVAAQPENVTALVLHGWCLFELRRFEDALEALAAAAALAPNEFVPQLFRGWILSECGRYEDAIVPLRRAYELKHQCPESVPDVLLLLSRCCLEQKLPQQGKTYLQELRRYPAFNRGPEVENALGVLRVYERDYEQAEQSFKQALAKDPDNAVVLQNLAVLNDSYLGRPRQAIRYYNDSIRVSQLVNDSSRQAKIRRRLQQIRQVRLGGRQPSADATAED